MMKQVDAPASEDELRQIRHAIQSEPIPDEEPADVPPPEDTTPGRRVAVRLRLRSTLVSVRWPALAVLATVLLSAAGAQAVNVLVSEALARWLLALAVMALILMIVMLLDVALQWSERAVLDWVQGRESVFLAEARRQTTQLLREE
jgi:hypothetical protein